MVRLKSTSRETTRSTPPFQFQMVRLKSSETSRRHRRTPVSIPNGSIKMTVLIRNSLRALMFQFQMVRLKSNQRSVGVHQIASFQFQMVRLKLFRRRRFSVSNLFQFQMVRLKCGQHQLLASGKHVSIPNGSIKIIREQHRRGGGDMFQFQMVRLK